MMQAYSFSIQMAQTASVRLRSLFQVKCIISMIHYTTLLFRYLPVSMDSLVTGFLYRSQKGFRMLDMVLLILKSIELPSKHILNKLRCHPS